jgi:hypothetical protein
VGRLWLGRAAMRLVPPTRGVYLRGRGQPVGTVSVGTMMPEGYFAERFQKFLENDWVHLERKVAALQAQVHLVLGMLSVLVGLIIYLVVRI